MCSRFPKFLVGLAVLPCLAQQARTLRVCADPNDMPLSNERGQGLENKLAQLVAARLGEPVEYTWWSERKSLVKHTLDQGRCDVLMGVPSSLDEASVTKPYYRSSYVFVSRRDRDLHMASLNDARLSSLRIGINVVGDGFVPPAAALASRGITRNVVGFPLVGAYGEADPARKIIEAVDRGEIDLAIVWGPVAGYFSQTASTPLAIEPVSPSSFDGIPFTFDFSMAVRKGDDALKAKLDNVIDSDSASIQQILTQFGVPQVQ